MAGRRGAQASGTVGAGVVGAGAVGAGVVGAFQRSGAASALGRLPSCARSLSVSLSHACTRTHARTQALNLLFLGDTNRTTSETPMNLASSRSHCIFTIFLTASKVRSCVCVRACVQAGMATSLPCLIDAAAAAALEPHNHTVFRSEPHHSPSLRTHWRKHRRLQPTK